MRANQTTTAVSDQPATLDRVIRQAISGGLQKSYEIERDVPHALLVILMQMNQQKQDAN